MRVLVALALLGLGSAPGCAKKSGGDAAKVEDGETLPDIAQTASRLIKDGDSLGTGIWSILHAGQTDDGADRPDAKQRIAQVGKLAAPALLEKWDDIAARAKEQATRRGVDRARGMSPDNCMGCDELPTMLDIVAPGVPALQAKWAALEPELVQVEAAAHDAEANDKRPQVFVQAREDFDVMALECTREALAARYPAYKWVSSGKVEGAIVRVTSKVASADYRNSQTNEQTKLMSGLEVTLTGEGLDPKLAKQLALPIVATANVDTPDAIRGSIPTVGPTLEASRLGIEKIQLLTVKVCGELSEQIAAGAK